MPLSLVLIVIMLGFVPLIIGAEMTRLLKTPVGLIQCYILGFFSMMAICEVIAVPCAFFKSSFSVVLVVFFVAVGILLLLSFVHNSPQNQCRVSDTFNGIKQYGWLEIVALVALIIVLGIISINSIRLCSIDEDDSRFVVTAADIMRTNKLFLTDPNTGITYSQWPYGGDVAKDIVAPHAIFCAIMAISTQTSAVVFMHTVYPVILYTVATGVYYLLITELLKNNEKLMNDKHIEAYKLLFIVLIYLYTIYHYSTRATAETMFLVRIWQGKAILASIIIPALLFVMLLIYNQSDNGERRIDDMHTSMYFYLVIFILAGCLTSSMATMLLPLIVFVYGLAYGIAKKSLKLTLCIWTTALPEIALALISVYIRNEMLLC